MGHFVFLLNTAEVPKSVVEPPNGHRIDIVDQYAFDASTLNGADGLLLSQHLDERHLGEHRAVLEDFLAAGGNIALNGPVARPFLDPPGPYRALAAQAAQDWVIEMATPHAVSAGVQADDLTYRRGVIGFWARGYFDAPASAISITRFATSSRRPADFLWQRPEGGWLFVHPGNDIWGYARDATSARRLFSQLLDWFAAVGR